MRMRHRILSVAVAVALAALLVAPASAAADDARMYRVTVTNLTAGQPLTPVLFATHRANADVFTVGSSASFGLKEIAENGNLAPLAEALGATTGVSEVFQGGMPIVPPGTPGSATFPDSVTFEISGERGARSLSWVSMLICTNDGFTGLDSLGLPRHVGDSVTVGTAGYDAGTELNTEDFADIVPPCQALIGVSSGEAGTGTSNPALAEGGVIHHHDGIQGGADLVPAIHGWDVNAPVAEVTVERIAQPIDPGAGGTISRRWVAPNGVISVAWQEVSCGNTAVGSTSTCKDRSMQIWSGDEPIKTVPRTNNKEVRKKCAAKAS